MKKFVIDASALIGITEGSAPALSLYRRLVRGEIELVAPEFLLVEFANVMKIGKKAAVGEVIGIINRLKGSGIRFVRIGADEVENVTKESFEGGLTIYDAIYVYLARKLKMKLITEDKRILVLKDIALTSERVGKIRLI